MNTMGIDQYGEVYRNLGLHPRKALLERLGRRHADKMYVDRADGSTRHIGYVVARLWIRLLKVEPWEKPA